MSSARYAVNDPGIVALTDWSLTAVYLFVGQARDRHQVALVALWSVLSFDPGAKHGFDDSLPLSLCVGETFYDPDVVVELVDDGDGISGE